MLCADRQVAHHSPTAGQQLPPSLTVMNAVWAGLHGSLQGGLRVGSGLGGLSYDLVKTALSQWLNMA